jgi:hypothetical protein
MKRGIILAIVAAWLLAGMPAFADKATVDECRKLDRQETSLQLKIAKLEAEYKVNCEKGSKAEWCVKRATKIEKMKDRHAEVTQRMKELRCKTE